MSMRKNTNKASVTLIEVMILQAKDQAVYKRNQGAPEVKKHAPPGLLGKDINDVSREDFERVVERYKSDSPLRRKGDRLIQDINGLLKWAILNGFRTTTWNPLKRPRTPKSVEHILSPEIVETILKAVDTHFASDLEIRISIRALVLLGLGAKETAHFSLTQVDFKRQEYHQRDYRGRYRIIPIPPSMGSLIARAWQCGDLFGSKEGKSTPWIQMLDLARMVHRVGLLSGLEKLLPSTLQRTAIQGMDDIYVTPSFGDPSRKSLASQSRSPVGGNCHDSLDPDQRSDTSCGAVWNTLRR